VYCYPTDEAYVALAVTYCFLAPYFLGHTMNYGSIFLLFCASLERLLEYRELPQELPHSCSEDPDLEVWPSEGGIAFEEVSCRYHPSLPLVLNRVSFTIRGGEHIGSTSPYSSTPQPTRLGSTVALIDLTPACSRQFVGPSRGVDTIVRIRQ